ncbi:mitochondrial import inner membrane translocase subunit Tim21 [Culicoides brevitarsis]|uniref:mitochondrial import inner membrane translocase subunit Tim21 n=1 Tax=Culicoides brevitarsis TaxID=469753 RepID=UPI00307C27BC
MTSQIMLRPFLLRHRLPSTFQMLSQRQYCRPARAIAEAKQSSELSEDVRPLGEKIKENTKTASYMGIILAGVGVTGIMFYAIFRELFSSQSPNNVYSEALDKCKNDTRIQDALGVPIKGYGEETRRGRRRHAAHTIYEKDGRTYMRMQFYLQGCRNKGTVYLEKRMNDAGKYEYRYLFVQMSYYPHETIVLEDNRINDPQPLAQQSKEFSFPTLS